MHTKVIKIVILFFVMMLLLAACGNRVDNHREVEDFTVEPNELETANTLSDTHGLGTEHIEHEGITAFGRQAVTEFLMQMPTLFMDGDTPMPVTGVGEPWERGFELEAGQFSLGMEFVDGIWRDIITYETPDIFFRRERDANRQPTENHGYFDRYGNRIIDVPWIWGDYYATSFRLWDFNHDGMPVITVYYAGNWEDLTSNVGVRGRMFKFIDGQYRDLEIVGESDNWLQTMITNWSDYYLSSEGNLLRSDTGFGGGQLVWFDYVELNDSRVHFTPM